MICAILITKRFMDGFANLPLMLVINISIGAIVYGLTLGLLVPEMPQKFIGLTKSSRLNKP